MGVGRWYRVRARLNHLAGRNPTVVRFWTRIHVWLYRASGGRLMSRWSGMPVLVLETVGRRSGRQWANPLVYLRDGGRLVVLAAAAGSDRTPAWWLNLRSAGRGLVHLGRERRWVSPHLVHGAERDRLWRRFAEAYPDIESFRSYTDRGLPLVILKRIDSPAPERDTRMDLTTQLGSVREVELSNGRVEYRERGTGPALLFVHGLWVNGGLWRKVVPPLSGRYRCVAPDLPFGAHRIGLKPGADLSPRGVAEMLAELIDKLGLEDVTLVANDTGTAFAQVFAAEYPHKIARLALTPGDAFTNFLPYPIKPMRLAAYVPGLMPPLAWFWRTSFGKRLIMAPLAKRRPPDEVLESFFRPATHSADIRGDLAQVLRHARPSVTLRAARKLPGFGNPTLIVWTKTGNLVFPLRHAHRLAELFPHSQLRTIEDSYAFIPEDQPEQLAALLDEFVTSSPAEPTAHRHSRAM